MLVYVITGIIIGGIVGLIVARPKRGAAEGAPRGPFGPPVRGGRLPLYAVIGAAGGAVIALLAYQSVGAGYPHSEYVVEIQSEAQFDEAVLKSDKPVLVDFYATWCGPCRQMAPVVGEIAKETQGRAVVAGVDVDRRRALADRYGVSGIPHFVIIRNGRPVKQFGGVQPKETLLNALLEE